MEGGWGGVSSFRCAYLVRSRAAMNWLNARRRRYSGARRPRTSHPSLSRNRISDLMKADSADSPRSPLSGISRWRADQVETKRVLMQLARMEYVPRKSGSSCQETVAFIVSDVGGGAGDRERERKTIHVSREMHKVPKYLAGWL